MKNKLLALIIIACVCISALALVGCDLGTPVSDNFVDLAGGNVVAEVGTLEQLGKYQEGSTMTKIRTLDDIYIPEKLVKQGGFGLFIWNAKKKDWSYSLDNYNLFDNEKPTLIYIHGMGGNGHIENPQHFYDNGYNVLSYCWGAYACESDFLKLADKVWMDDPHRYSVDDGDTWETKDLADANVTEMFLAYYYDLFEQFPGYKGSKIEIMGFSYGGFVVSGVTSIMTTAYTTNLLPAYMLPDEFTFLDPYLSRGQSNTAKVPWLGDKTPEKQNVLDAAYQSMKLGRELGITYRLIRTSALIASSTAMVPYTKQSYLDMITESVYVQLDADSSNEILNKTAIDTDPSSVPASTLHAVGDNWYTVGAIDRTYYDTASGGKEIAICFNMDYDTSFARHGAIYKLNTNHTIYTYTDDTVTSEGMTTSKIAGFAYLDANKDGVKNERIKDHFKGVTVTITDKDDNVVYTGETGLNGYYEFETTKTGEYTVTFTAPKGYEIAESTQTAKITDGTYQVVIVNAGLTK